jgi:hypothetical protein
MNDPQQDLRIRCQLTNAFNVDDVLLDKNHFAAFASSIHRDPRITDTLDDNVISYCQDWLTGDTDNRLHCLAVRHHTQSVELIWVHLVVSNGNAGFRTGVIKRIAH